MAGAQTLEKPRRKAKPKPKAGVKPGARPALPPVMPYLVCTNAADAIAFYKKAFGAVEILRVPGPDGRLMNAQLRIGDAPFMLMDEMPEFGALSPKSLKGTPVTIHLYVDDVDAFFERAVKAGATVKVPVSDMFWGDRYCNLVDPFGHNWSAATHLRDVTQQEMLEAMRNAPSCGPGEQ